MALRTQHHVLLASALMLTLLGTTGSCNNPVSPGKDLQVTNVADNFQFQVTALQNYSNTYVYAWTNSGTAATVNQASSLLGGIATLSINDNSGALVYSKSVAANGTFDTAVGAAGTWSIKLVTHKASGTLNFRVQKKP